jgi:uncharacterized protein YndB with AHSA1/START domain
MKLPACVLIAAFVAAPAHAEVVGSGDGWFELSNQAKVSASPDKVWRLLLALPEWWDSAHTYSGDSRNLMLDSWASGCFCETVPSDGSQIAHGRIVYMKPGSALRLDAALGPLQAMAVKGTLAWTLKADGEGTLIRQSYVVSGHFPGGAPGIAKPVDDVMSGQFQRLVAASAR